MSEQLALDFDAPRVTTRPSKAQLKAEAKVQAEDDAARNAKHWRMARAEAREYWKVCMVTSLPCFATVLDSEQRFTQMLPGVVESITDDTATVRIYAAPAWGYTIEDYPLHMKLAIDVPLTDLGKFGNKDLQHLVDDGRLATGCEVLAEAIRKRMNYMKHNR